MGHNWSIVSSADSYCICSSSVTAPNLPEAGIKKCSQKYILHNLYGLFSSPVHFHFPPSFDDDKRPSCIILYKKEMALVRKEKRLQVCLMQSHIFVLYHSLLTMPQWNTYLIKRLCSPDGPWQVHCTQSLLCREELSSDVIFVTRILAIPTPISEVNFSRFYADIHTMHTK